MQELIKIQKRIIICLIFYICFLFILILGVTGNFLVIKNNSGKMPVYAYIGEETETHFAYQDSSEIKYPFFSDRFRLGKRIYSIGDFFLIFAGTGIVVISILLIVYHYKYKKYSRLNLKREKPTPFYEREYVTIWIINFC